jgi:hypothetical protein
MPYQLFMGQWNHSLTCLTKFLQGSYQSKTVEGTTGGSFVIPVRAWHQDCKGLFLYRSEVFMRSLGGLNIVARNSNNLIQKLQD